MGAKWTIFEQDCLLGIEEHVGEGTVDVIVTSPPYNIGKAYNRYDDSREEGHYLEWMARVSAASAKALSRHGSFFLNLGGKPSDPGWPIRVLEVFRHEFALQNTILWVKSIAIDLEDVAPNPLIGGDIAFGHYKPVNSDRYLNPMTEYVFHLTKEGDVPLDKLSIGVPYRDKSNVGRWAKGKGDRRDRGNVWFIPYDTINKSRPHPCVFPVKLPMMCIKLHGCEKTGLVLDPFVGTGSTALACRKLGVNFVGFDIDPYYAGLARKLVLEYGRGKTEIEVSDERPSRPRSAG
jgi:site-specific DNA-methyltransferase (adenine-specific)